MYTTTSQFKSFQAINSPNIGPLTFDYISKKSVNLYGYTGSLNLKLGPFSDSTVSCTIIPIGSSNKAVAK
ncbi:hypothetical protein EXN66_Car008533 [Channa argus]|uniref:Uncharacterized protein n=1 Tax=Channa argus TaxID=215402 RepID=A0A6G1PRK7_CHAAH|nr:hypothetical protein EXN66_Car008533 [Channa argus]